MATSKSRFTVRGATVSQSDHEFFDCKDAEKLVKDHKKRIDELNNLVGLQQRDIVEKNNALSQVQQERNSLKQEVATLESQVDEANDNIRKLQQAFDGITDAMREFDYQKFVEGKPYSIAWLDYVQRRQMEDAGLDVSPAEPWPETEAETGAQTDAQGGTEA